MRLSASSGFTLQCRRTDREQVTRLDTSSLAGVFPAVLRSPALRTGAGFEQLRSAADGLKLAGPQLHAGCADICAARPGLCSAAHAQGSPRPLLTLVALSLSIPRSQAPRRDRPAPIQPHWPENGQVPPMENTATKPSGCATAVHAPRAARQPWAESQRPARCVRLTKGPQRWDWCVGVCTRCSRLARMRWSRP